MMVTIKMTIIVMIDDYNGYTLWSGGRLYLNLLACAAQDVLRRKNSYRYLHFLSALEIFGRVDSTLNKRTFRECLDAIVKSFTDEDVFESLIEFLTKSVEVRT